MITFIIPTLWKSDKIHETIKFFKSSDRKDIELIIIDNSNSEFLDTDPRINVIKFKENIFVNPAWNLGVSLAKNPFVCLLNDDIVLNVQCLLNQFEDTFFFENLGFFCYLSSVFLLLLIIVVLP